MRPKSAAVGVWGAFETIKYNKKSDKDLGEAMDGYKSDVQKRVRVLSQIKGRRLIEVKKKKKVNARLVKLFKPFVRKSIGKIELERFAKKKTVKGKAKQDIVTARKKATSKKLPVDPVFITDLEEEIKLKQEENQRKKEAIKSHRRSASAETAELLKQVGNTDLAAGIRFTSRYRHNSKEKKMIRLRNCINKQENSPKPEEVLKELLDADEQFFIERKEKYDSKKEKINKMTKLSGDSTFKFKKQLEDKFLNEKGVFTKVYSKFLDERNPQIELKQAFRVNNKAVTANRIQKNFVSSRNRIEECLDRNLAKIEFLKKIK